MPHDKEPQHLAELTTTEISELWVASHVRLKRVVDDGMQAAGLSLARTKLLNQLRTDGPMRQHALAECFGFAARSITDMVDSLERDGLAERLEDPSDRRAKIVRITEAGRTAVNAALAARDELIEHIFGVLSASDRAELARLIWALNRSISTLPQAPPPSELVFSPRRPVTG